MFINLVWAPKLANIPPCYVFTIQIIDGNYIFSDSLAKFANMVQDRKVDKHTPPSRGGLLSTVVYSFFNSFLECDSDSLFWGPAAVLKKLGKTGGCCFEKTGQAGCCFEKTV